MKCVACHVVSRDGKYLVAPVDATSGKSLWVTEVTKDAPPNPLVKSIANTDGHGFATISPDDATVIAAFGGKMWTVDRATGAFGANLNLGALKGTHPDWSPDGKQVVFATADGDAPAGASLALLPFQNGQWGSAHEDRGPAPERHEQADGDQPLSDALAGRQVDRLHARREGRPRRPDLPAVDGGRPPAGRPSSS